MYRLSSDMNYTLLISIFLITIAMLNLFQDSLPAKPFSVIKAQVEFELGRSLQSVFSHVDETPLACASIAQVRSRSISLN